MPSTETHPAGIAGDIARIRDAVELIVEGVALPAEIRRAEARLRPLVALVTGERAKQLLANAAHKLDRADLLLGSLYRGELPPRGALTVAELIFDAFDCLCWAAETFTAPSPAPASVEAAA